MDLRYLNAILREGDNFEPVKLITKEVKMVLITNFIPKKRTE